MEEWYRVSRHHKVMNNMVERIVPNTTSPDLFDVYGVEVGLDGKFSSTKLLDIVQDRDRHKIRLKSWLKQILVTETYYKTGDYFARRVIPVLAITLVYDDVSDQWDRLEIGGEEQKRISGGIQEDTEEG